MGRNLSTVVSCVAALLAGGVAWGAYPERPIRLVVPFPPGGTADVVARLVGQPVAQALGQPIVIDNRPGADGAIAAELVMKSLPDGHTLFFGTNSAMSAVPTLRRKPPYDPVAGFTHVSLVGYYTFFLFAHPSLPARTLAELVEHAKSQPGKLIYGTGNTTSIVAMAQLRSVAGIDMTHVPYKGDAPTTGDLLPGRIHVAFMAAVPGFGYVRDGRLRALATLLTERSTLAPEVPTMAEAGMPKVNVSSWAAVFGPPGVPAAVVNRLSQEFNAVLSRPDMRDQLGRQGFQAQASTPSGLREHVATQLDAWRRIVREANIQVD